ncbi:MAG: TonB-dependent receptor [Candidatus Aminicenantes bacterium]|nr:TonB-dependent receptor [Candidatus Aminicenantes bacterium]
MSSSSVVRMLLSISILAFLVWSTAIPALPSTSDDKQTQSSESEAKKLKDTEKKTEKEVEDLVLHNEIIVTATRTETTVFDSPKPVSVVNQKKIEERSPNNISELMPEIPGTDMVGVGANQSRPVIRGLYGQRILLLSDGDRLSNSRRTQAFGEIPALTEVYGMERVEIVRGPASVLYGSEAIGGVINIINMIPDYPQKGTNISGHLGYRYSSASEQHKGFASVGGNIGKIGFMLSGSYRNAKNYLAPAGSFGNITLAQDTPVHDTGVQDNSFSFFLGMRVTEKDDISFKYEQYDARDFGYGYVEPGAYSPGDPLIQLFYPRQKFQKFTLGYENRALSFLLADGISLKFYYLNNVRDFNTNININFSPAAGMNIQSSSYTNVDTFGTRFELTKVLFQKHVLTYGIDFFHDNSENTDINTTKVFGFGPPAISVNNIPNVPYASFRSFGIFIQDQFSLFPRSKLILGLRYQNVLAQTKKTPNIDDPLVDSSESTVVGSANFTYDLLDSLKLVLSLGRGFRSPNLPERFFQGLIPDGRGFQLRNSELKPETSLNFDIGLRFRYENLYLESTLFRNMIYDGIQIIGTGTAFDRIPEYQNINIDKLQIQGLEALGHYYFDFGLSLMANYSYIDSKNLTNPELMNADTYGSRLNFSVRYNFPRDLFWVEYHIRHQGDRKDIDLGNNPIGSIIPGFTVHSLRTGITLFENSPFPQQIGIIVGNITNALYSEFSNASFFRPAPRRHVVLTWNVSF